MDIEDTISFHTDSSGYKRTYVGNNLESISFGNPQVDGWIAYYKDGLIHGQMITRSKGKLRIESTNRNGYKHGIHKEFDSEGNVELELFYSFGIADPNVLLYGKYVYEPWRVKKNVSVESDPWFGKKDAYEYGLIFEEYVKQGSYKELDEMSQNITKKTFDHSILHGLVRYVCDNDILTISHVVELYKKTHNYPSHTILSQLRILIELRDIRCEQIAREIAKSLCESFQDRLS